MSDKNYYQILKIAPDASKEEVEKAFQKIEKKYRMAFAPKSVAERTRKNAEWQEVINAYNTLSDDSRRQEYDAQLSLPEKEETEPKQDIVYDKGIDWGNDTPTPETIPDKIIDTDNNINMDRIIKNEEDDEYDYGIFKIFHASAKKVLKIFLISIIILLSTYHCYLYNEIPDLSHQWILGILTITVILILKFIFIFVLFCTLPFSLITITYRFLLSIYAHFKIKNFCHMGKNKIKLQMIANDIKEISTPKIILSGTFFIVSLYFMINSPKSVFIKILTCSLAIIALILCVILELRKYHCPKCGCPFSCRPAKLLCTEHIYPAVLYTYEYECQLCHNKRDIRTSLKWRKKDKTPYKRIDRRKNVKTSEVKPDKIIDWGNNIHTTDSDYMTPNADNNDDYSIFKIFRSSYKIPLIIFLISVPTALSAYLYMSYYNIHFLSHKPQHIAFAFTLFMAISLSFLTLICRFLLSIYAHFEIKKFFHGEKPEITPQKVANDIKEMTSLTVIFFTILIGIPFGIWFFTFLFKSDFEGILATGIISCVFICWGLRNTRKYRCPECGCPFSLVATKLINTIYSERRYSIYDLYQCEFTCQHCHNKIIQTTIAWKKKKRKRKKKNKKV